MPSAHGPTFCRKQLRENIGLIQRTQPDFSSQTKNWTLTLRLECHVAHMAGFLSDLLCSDIPLLGYIILIFYRTEVSAHGPIYYRRHELSEGKVCFLLVQNSAHRFSF